MRSKQTAAAADRYASTLPKPRSYADDPHYARASRLAPRTKVRKTAGVRVITCTAVLVSIALYAHAEPSPPTIGRELRSGDVRVLLDGDSRRMNATGDRLEQQDAVRAERRERDMRDRAAGMSEEQIQQRRRREQRRDEVAEGARVIDDREALKRERMYDRQR